MVDRAFLWQLAAIDESLAKLGLEHVDLYLIHHPTAFGSSAGKVLETWRAMLEIKAAGKARAVGVSNFGVSHLEGIRAAGLEMPAVNQVELHPWLQQKELRACCRREDVALMGFCPLARGEKFGSSPLGVIAARLGRTEAQVAIRWSLQVGAITIPKSTNAARLAQNADVFGWALDEATMAQIAADVDEGHKVSSAVNGQDLPWAEIM